VLFQVCLAHSCTREQRFNIPLASTSSDPLLSPLRHSTPCIPLSCKFYGISSSTPDKDTIVFDYGIISSPSPTATPEEVRVYFSFVLVQKHAFSEYEATDLAKGWQHRKGVDICASRVEHIVRYLGLKLGAGSFMVCFSTPYAKVLGFN